MFNKIKKECKKHTLCKDCPLYYEVKACVVAPPPMFWKKREVKKLLKGVNKDVYKKSEG